MKIEVLALQPGDQVIVEGASDANITVHFRRGETPLCKEICFNGAGHLAGVVSRLIRTLLLGPAGLEAIDQNVPPEKWMEAQYYFRWYYTIQTAPCAVPSSS